MLLLMMDLGLPEGPIAPCPALLDIIAGGEHRQQLLLLLPITPYSEQASCIDSAKYTLITTH